MHLHKYMSISILLLQVFLCTAACEHKFIFENPRIPFPEPFRQKLANSCQQELLAKEIKDLQETNKDLAAKSKNISQEINETKKYNANLEKKIKDIEIQKKQLTKETEQRAPKTKIQQQKKPDKNQKFTPREKLNCLKALKKNYSVREQIDLFEHLDQGAINAYEVKSKNFHPEHHLWRGPINNNYKFVFWSCGSQLLYFRTNDRLIFPQGFGCTEKCKNYKKHNDLSSHSIESDTVSDSSEEFVCAIFSKKDIENMSN